MGTAILRSHDFLQDGFRRDAWALTTSPVRSRRNPNPKPYSCAYHNRRRKRSPVAVQADCLDRDRRRCGDRSVVAKGPATNLVMGQVKILKRGEKLSPEINRGLAVSTKSPRAMVKSEEDFDLALGSTDRLGPDPVTVKKQIRISDWKDGIYAGSAIIASPPPNSLPLPRFLGKKGAATSGLRAVAAA